MEEEIIAKGQIMGLVSQKKILRGSSHTREAAIETLVMTAATPTATPSICGLSSWTVTFVFVIKTSTQ